MLFFSSGLSLEDTATFLVLSSYQVDLIVELGIHRHPRKQNLDSSEEESFPFFSFMQYFYFYFLRKQRSSLDLCICWGKKVCRSKSSRKMWMNSGEQEWHTVIYRLWLHAGSTSVLPVYFPFWENCNGETISLPVSIEVDTWSLFPLFLFACWKQEKSLFSPFQWKKKWNDNVSCEKREDDDDVLVVWESTIFFCYISCRW